MALENFNIVDHGIHYIDLSRFFTGRTPVRVKATTTHVPGQAAVSPMIYSILCEYEPGAQVMTTLHFNNIIAASGLHRYEWLIDGTEGSLVASQSEVTVCLKENPAASIFHVPVVAGVNVIWDSVPQESSLLVWRMQLGS